VVYGNRIGSICGIRPYRWLFIVAAFANKTFPIFFKMRMCMGFEAALD
jgi:hypothetical protein